MLAAGVPGPAPAAAQYSLTENLKDEYDPAKPNDYEEVLRERQQQRKAAEEEAERQHHLKQEEEASSFSLLLRPVWHMALRRSTHAAGAAEAAGPDQPDPRARAGSAEGRGGGWTPAGVCASAGAARRRSQQPGHLWRGGLPPQGQASPRLCCTLWPWPTL